MQSLRKPPLCCRAAQRIALAASIGGMLVSCFEARAQAQERIRGKVERLTTAPRGEIDGAILDDGTTLHWPPHLEDQFRRAVAVGDKIEATGRQETGKRGEARFEVERLTNLDTDATAVNDGRKPPKSPKSPKERDPRRGPEAGDRKMTTVSGVVRRLTTAPKGEIDGAILDDGTTLHWPPHLEDRFQEVAAVGKRVEAAGRSKTGKRGETRFEVARLTNLETNASAENDAARAKPARPRADDVETRLRTLEEQVRRLERKIDRLIDER